jgi:hypothetical protein
MSPENREALLSALRAARRQQGRVYGVMRFECAMTSCPVQVVTLRVQEEAGGKLLQNPMKCCRCGSELYFLTLEEGGRGAHH